MSSNPPIDYSRYYLKYHSEDAAHYSRLVRHYRSLLQSELGALSKNAEILDVGCGMGGCVYALRQLGYQLILGIDTSAEQIAAGRRKDLPVTRVDDSVGYLNAHPGRFTLITCFDVIEHVPVDAQIAFVQAIHTALAPGGKLVCTVPNASSALAARWRYNDWTHHSSFTEQSLDFVLYNAGFRHIEIGGTDRRPRWPLVPRKSVALWLLRSYFRFMRRLEMGAEIGFAQAKRVPLSVNLKAVAGKI